LASFGHNQPVDPWHDYLAIPIAPLVLLVQGGSLFARRRSVRWGLAIGCFAAIAAMFAYVSSIETQPDEGVNIGAGVLLLWFFASLLLLAVGLAREGVVALFRLVRRSARPS
jgi:hypothetical protein